METRIRKVYVVVRQGVYLRGIFGVSLDAETAVKDAKNFALNDVDSHHQWEVLEITLGSFSPDQFLDLNDTWVGYKDPDHEVIFRTCKRYEQGDKAEKRGTTWT